MMSFLVAVRLLLAMYQAGVGIITVISDHNAVVTAISVDGRLLEIG